MRLTCSLPILVGQTTSELEMTLLLGAHLGHSFSNLRPQPVHLRGQGLVLGHNTFYLVKAPLSVLRRFHCALQDEHMLTQQDNITMSSSAKDHLP